MINKNITFLTDYGRNKGIGHLIRTIWLSEYFMKKGFYSNVICREFNQNFVKSFHKTIFLNDFKTDEILKNLSDKKDHILFFDLPPDLTLKSINYDYFITLLETIRNEYSDNFIYAAFDDLEVLNNIDNFITFCYQTPNNYRNKTHYAGLQFTPLSQEIFRIKTILDHKVREKGLMVFFGGSDPASHTESFLNLFYDQLIDYSQDIYIIIGYNNKLDIDLYKLASNIMICRSPENWTDYIRLIDKAIISGGLLKYDLIYLNKNIMVVPQNDLELNCIKKMNKIMPLPYISRLEPENINKFLRKEDSEIICPEELTGKGIDKIYSILTKKLKSIIE